MTQVHFSWMTVRQLDVCRWEISKHCWTFGILEVIFLTTILLASWECWFVLCRDCHQRLPLSPSADCGSPGIIPDWGFPRDLPKVLPFALWLQGLFTGKFKSLLYSNLLFPCLCNGANNSVPSCLEISTRACMKMVRFVIALWGSYVVPTTLSPVIRWLTKIWQWPSLLSTVINSCFICILSSSLLESIPSLVERICSFLNLYITRIMIGTWRDTCWGPLYG